MSWLDTIRWDAQGLVPAIAQEKGSGDVLMFAWMNRLSLEASIKQKKAMREIFQKNCSFRFFHSV